MHLLILDFHVKGSLTVDRNNNRPQLNPNEGIIAPGECWKSYGIPLTTQISQYYYLITALRLTNRDESRQFGYRAVPICIPGYTI